jgi:sporulation protein YlmC with PRC-barrel domain
MHTRETLDRPNGLTADYVGHEVLDEHGLHLGVVTDVVYDEQDGHPEYLAVDPGLLRPAHYVPVSGSYHTNQGQIVVPWDKHWVKTAPKAVGDHLPTANDRRELRAHYTDL